MPPRPPGRNRVHELSAARDSGKRHAASQRLGGRDQVGHDPLVLTGEHRPGASESGLNLVSDEHDAVLVRELLDGLQVARPAAR